MDNQFVPESVKPQVDSKIREWNFLKVLFILFAYGFGIFIDGIAPGLLFPEKEVPDEGGIRNVLGSMLVTLLGLGILLLIYKCLYKRLFPYAQSYTFEKIDRELLLAIFLITPFFVFVKAVLFNLDTVMDMNANEFFTVDTEVKLADLTGLLRELPLVAVLGQVFEEFSYRILPLSSYRTKRGRIIAGSVTAICFSLLHGSSFALVLVDAIIYTIIFLKSRNLWLSIVLHMAYNLSTIIVPVLSIGHVLVFPQANYGVMGSPLPVVVALSILLVVGTLLLNRICKKRRSSSCS